MNLGQIRTMVQRRLNDEHGDGWSGSELNELVNLALLEVSKAELRFDPDAPLCRDVASIVSGQEMYEKPSGFFHEVAVKVLNSTTGRYDTLDPLTYAEAQGRDEGSVLKYFHFGRRYFGLSPIPTAAVASGLLIDYAGTTLLSNDTDVPRLHIALHYAIVLRAQIMANGESGEGSEAAAAEYSRIIADIPSWLIPPAGAAKPTQISVAFDKGY